MPAAAIHPARTGEPVWARARRGIARPKVMLPRPANATLLHSSAKWVRQRLAYRAGPVPPTSASVLDIVLNAGGNR
ncbi:hypothetical protein GCM10007079_24760 [Nocardiopsis terrae]|nr:hypothetical protein GCM10007079_24760 [Nocardiopsis terrae]